MGDDDVVAVHRAHEIADHAVLVDGHFLGVEMFSPFRQPPFLGRRDFLLERGERIAAAGSLLPAGTLGPNGVRVRLEPTASTRSAFAMNSMNIFGRERVDAPSASGWLSGMALLPGFVVTTGAGMSSAKALSRSLASA